MAEKKTVSVKVYNMAGEEVSKMALNAAVFNVEPHQQVMFDAVQVEQANARQATAKTKTRKEVRGGGKKPFRQKGTGRARAGSRRSPIWVGGGTIFGPVGNQNYKLSQNKKEHKLALKSALSLKTKNGLVVVDAIQFEEMKTKNFVTFLDAFKVDRKALVVVDEITEEIYASARNIRYAKVVTPDNVSVLDLLNVENLIVSKTSIKTIEEALR
ncbi:MAG: 50S ribosomal protein L4 [Erysipelotrichia bacterium]|nr:50S ribosomal protein L4 [Erysipelotrichia bacterium]